MNTAYVQDGSLEKSVQKLRNLIGDTIFLLELEKKQDVKSRNRPGRTWSCQEELGHLIDSAFNNIQRFMRLQIPAHMENGVLHAPGYHADEWVRVAKHNQKQWLEMVNLWQALNLHIMFLLSQVDPENLKNVWMIGNEKLSLEWLMIDYVGHTQHHLNNILGRKK